MTLNGINLFDRPDWKNNHAENGAVVDCIAATSQTTSLILAASNDHERVVSLLLQAGANVNAINSYGP